MSGNSFGNLALPAPVGEISGVWRFERRAGGRSLARSPGGHLLHYVVSGECELSIDRRRCRVREGDLIYYGALEEVDSHFLSDYVFYSVAFRSTVFAGLPPEGRVVSGMFACLEDFPALEAAYRAGDALSGHAALLRMLGRLPAVSRSSTASERWLAIEGHIRKHAGFRPDLDKLCRRFGVSRATLLRDCRRATGLSLREYLWRRRMDEALALLRLSDMSVGEIADRLGYARINEFSREFAKSFGIPPSAERLPSGA